MRSLTILTVLIVLAVALGACAPAAAPAPAASPAASATALNLPTISVPVTGGTETPAVSLPGDIAGTSTVEAALATATSPGSAVDPATGVTIGTSTGSNASEPFLVDQQGRALYLFTTDVQNSGSSACVEDCLSQWQPVLVTGIPQAGTGVDAALLGTITRQDGSLQATYNGWPLYTFAGDMAPGDTNGQGMGSAWFLVSGTGNSIQP